MEEETQVEAQPRRPRQIAGVQAEAAGQVPRPSGRVGVEAPRGRFPVEVRQLVLGHRARTAAETAVPTATTKVARVAAVRRPLGVRAEDVVHEGEVEAARP